MGRRKGGKTSARVLPAGILLALIFALAWPAAPRGAEGEAGTSESAVLPCKKRLALTAIYRADGKVRFEGVADRSLTGKLVRVYEIKSDDLVATTRIRRDGTWWAHSRLPGGRYTWLTKFVAEAGPAQSRWRRLGQAVAIRERTPIEARSRRSDRTRVRVKVSGDSADRLVIGVQTGCSRYEVRDRFRVRTDRAGVATLNLPRPDVGDPYEIYRVRTADGLKISPPIVLTPSS